MPKNSLKWQFDPQKIDLFAPLALRYGGASLENATQAMLCLGLLALACAQIIVTAQAMDGLIVWLFGETLAFAPGAEDGPIIRSTKLSVMPFPENTFGVSLGFLLNALICIVLGFLPLSGNIVPQYVFFSMFIFAFVVFVLWVFGWCVGVSVPARVGVGKREVRIL